MKLNQLPDSKTGEYCNQIPLDVYDSPNCNALATQAIAHRYLTIISPKATDEALQIRLCEDGYEGWLSLKQLKYLTAAETAYQASQVSREEIKLRIPYVIDFILKAMKQPNYYLWGGTIGPNYDCSGLIQTAFVASGIWLPRDSYQQADFTESISKEDLQPGDLIFFAKQNKVDHVALYLGDNQYIHSSGKEIGRNGTGIDQLSESGDEVSRAYFQRFYGCGRVVASL
jgi:cell wall-associated NlpC family hydrolase